MEKKLAYSPILPPYPGQAYFVTICLWNAVAPGALSNYTNSLRELEWKIDYRKKHQQYDRILKELEIDYSQTRRRYFKAFDRLLAKNTDRTIDLNNPEISKIITGGITFWAPSHIENYAWCIMPNHVHWVFRTRERDHEGNPVYVTDILKSVKEHTTRKINSVLEREGPFWLEENFEIAIRDDKRLGRVLDYTLNNPVAAKLVDIPNQWPGSWKRCGL